MHNNTIKCNILIIIYLHNFVTHLDTHYASILISIPNDDNNI